MDGHKGRSFFPITRKPSLPVSHNNEGGGLIRRRLSSMSLGLGLGLQPPSSFPIRSKSLDYAGSSVKKWWKWGWDWILSRKPMFARDLEMNEHETKMLRSNDRGTWRHVFYKLRSEITRLITFSSSSSEHIALPQTYRPSPAT